MPDNVNTPFYPILISIMPFNFKFNRSKQLLRIFILDLKIDFRIKSLIEGLKYSQSAFNSSPYTEHAVLL